MPFGLILSLFRILIRFERVDKFLVLSLSPVKIRFCLKITNIPPKSTFQTIFDQNAVISLGNISFVCSNRGWWPLNFVENANIIAKIVIGVSQFFFAWVLGILRYAHRPSLLFYRVIRYGFFAFLLIPFYSKHVFWLFWIDSGRHLFIVNPI